MRNILNNATSAATLTVIAGLAACLIAGSAGAEDRILKIGVLGTMSGPAASWGLVSKYAAEATAQMYNEKGGVKIGEASYKIQIVAVDDRLDVKYAIPGAEQLTRKDHIKYIIGPNVDTTAVAIVPVIESAGAINVTYSFWRSLYTSRDGNSILGMVASYQAAPLIYRYLMDSRGVKTVSFVARSETDPLNQRTEGVRVAKSMGLKVLSADVTYKLGTTDFHPVLEGVVKQKPDLTVLSGVAPAEAPLLVKAARELGFKGQLSTETAQDAKLLREGAGEAADGFISVGGASAAEIRSPYMESFIDHYKKIAGEWNDEAGTKAYALEMLLATLQKAGPKAIGDIDQFKEAMPKVALLNPFMRDKSLLRYVGRSSFGRLRQIGVPVVVNEFRDGDFKTLFTASVSD